MNQQKTLASKLYARSVGQSHAPSLTRAKDFFSSYPRRLHIDAQTIWNDSAADVNSHVILGFSKSGCHLLSCVVDSTTHGGDHPYTTWTPVLFWWKFNHRDRLELVRRIVPFDEYCMSGIRCPVVYVIEDPLVRRIVVVAVATHPNFGSKETRECFVMIGPNPANGRRRRADEIADFSASFFIKCNAPFPRFSARTALAFEETFLLNAGEEIRAIRIAEGCTLTDKGLIYVPTSIADSLIADYGSTNIEPDPAVSHVNLDLNVQRGRQTLIPVKPGAWMKRYEDCSDADAFVCVTINVFSVYKHLHAIMNSNERLKSYVRQKSGNFRSLPYTTQVVDVDEENQSVLVLATLFSSFPMLLVWSITTGVVETLSMTGEADYKAILEHVRARWSIPKKWSVSFATFLSSKPFLDGKSLEVLQNPLLPVSLVKFVDDEET